MEASGSSDEGWMLGAIKDVVRGVRNKVRPPTKIHIGEQSADWYDKEFDEVEQYRQHYTEINYYFLWSVVADRILRSGVRQLIDIGCGPGQFASLLRDRGFGGYTGVDFNPARIAHASQLCPSFRFVVADLTKSTIIADAEYDGLVTMEFLEHVEFDLDVLRRIRSGTKVWATVPNFPYVSHVRHFLDSSQVSDRYGMFFSGMTVDSFVENQKGKTFFLIEGTRR